MAEETEDKREGERITILGELHGEVMVYQPTAVKEISRRGAQVETSFPLQLNSLREFRLTLCERSVVMKGRFAHCAGSLPCRRQQASRAANRAPTPHARKRDRPTLQTPPSTEDAHRSRTARG